MISMGSHATTENLARCADFTVAFATRLDKQGQHYGKPLITALLSHLDASGESCYLETVEAKNVALYQHFSFQLEGEMESQMGNLTLYAMRRPGDNKRGAKVQSA